MTTQMPVRRQMAVIRQRHPDTILLFRLGDFLEAYDDDARTVAHALDTRIVSRKMHDGSRSDVTGFPVSVGESYVGHLVDAGHRVAICEQTGN